MEAPIGGGSGCAGAQTVCMGHTRTWVEAFEDGMAFPPEMWTPVHMPPPPPEATDEFSSSTKV